MNRRVTLVGVLLLVVAVALVVSPIVLTGAERITPLFELGILMMPPGLLVVLFGLSAPNPEGTTVGGAFGNPDENVLARLERKVAGPSHLRYVPSPREPVNCRYCYTLIQWNVAECPRCSRRRLCRGCGRPLFFLSGAVRCAPCVRDEVYCSCPKLRRATAPAVGRPHPR